MQVATLTRPASVTRATEARHHVTDRRADLVQTVRWAPAPRWEGTAAKKARYVAYLVGSMLAWVAIGLGAAAALGGLTSLAG
jgi:hypothetical protein